MKPINELVEMRDHLFKMGLGLEI